MLMLRLLSSFTRLVTIFFDFIHQTERGDRSSDHSHDILTVLVVRDALLSLGIAIGYWALCRTMSRRELLEARGISVVRTFIGKSRCWYHQYTKLYFFQMRVYTIYWIYSRIVGDPEQFRLKYRNIISFQYFLFTINSIFTWRYCVRL